MGDPQNGWYIIYHMRYVYNELQWKILLKWMIWGYHFRTPIYTWSYNYMSKSYQMLSCTKLAATKSMAWSCEMTRPLFVPLQISATESLAPVEFQTPEDLSCLCPAEVGHNMSQLYKTVTMHKLYIVLYVL